MLCMFFVDCCVLGIKSLLVITMPCLRFSLCLFSVNALFGSQRTSLFLLSSLKMNAVSSLIRLHHSQSASFHIKASRPTRVTILLITHYIQDLVIREADELRLVSLASELEITTSPDSSSLMSLTSHTKDCFITTSFPLSFHQGTITLV